MVFLIAKKIRPTALIFVFALICFCFSSAVESSDPIGLNPVQIKKTVIARGQTLVVNFYADAELAVNAAFVPKGEFLSRPLYFYKVISPADKSPASANAAANHYRAYIPISLMLEPGFYPLKVFWHDAKNDYCEQIERIQILPGEFPAVQFSVPPAKKSLLKGPVVMDDWSQIESVLTRESDRQLWQGNFVYPLKGDYYLTLPFGARETVNGQKRAQHRGIDFGSPQKQKASIYAINRGRVILARPFKVFGGTVVLDHGQGIFSLYYHLSKILVSEGQMVEKAKILGKMGTTGVSSGVHLHLGLSVHNERVDARQWLEGEI